MDGQEIQQAEAASADNPELERLIREAGMINQDFAEVSPEAIQAEQAAVQADQLALQNADGFRMLFGLAGGVLTMVGFPTAGACFTPERTEPVAAAWGPLAAKYGWDLADLGGAYREEIGAAIATMPLAIAVWGGIKADAAARAAEQPKPAQVTAGAPAPGLKPGDPHYQEPSA